MKSGSGKTLLTCGLLALWKRKYENVGAFKCGPDFIDPMFHSKVLGIHTTNLDTFFTSWDTTKSLMYEHAKDKDISVLEGVMGFYDGIGAVTTKASTYEVAKATQTPVFLVLDMKGMSLSAAAVIKGFLEFREDHTISGIILNRTSKMLYPRMKEMLEKETNLPVVGYMPEIKDISFTSRHLGLRMPEEITNFKEQIEQVADVLSESLDLERILAVAKSAKELVYSSELEDKIEVYSKTLQTMIHRPIHIAVARDEAFCFLYEDNLRLLQKMGAKITYFSPIHDKQLPENMDGMILYGGYPELYAKQLSENEEMKHKILGMIRKKVPILAECGGFLYLTKTLEAVDGTIYDMVGAIPANSGKKDRLVRFGYITLEGNAFGTTLSEIKAHEFHYYDTNLNGTDFYAKKAGREDGWECIHADRTSFIGFAHCYYYGNLELPFQFLRCAARYEKRGNEHEK